MNFLCNQNFQANFEIFLAQVATGLVTSNWIEKRRTCHNFMLDAGLDRPGRLSFSRSGQAMIIKGSLVRQLTIYEHLCIMEIEISICFLMCVKIKFMVKWSLDSDAVEVGSGYCFLSARLVS